MQLVIHMKQWPNNSKKLIQFFGRLPGIGPKMAERVVLFLQRQSPDTVKEFASTLQSLHSSVQLCTNCYTLSENSICSICSDVNRKQDTLLIVADPVTAYTLEQSGDYDGAYFILGGNLNPLDGLTPEKLRFKELVLRLKKPPHVQEVILGFNATVDGEATQLYIKKLLSGYDSLRLTRLARGLPIGSDIAYADTTTLREAISGRQDL